MKIKLDHINLTVQNIPESIDWYSKVFGFKQVEKGISTKGQPWTIIASNDSMIVMSEYKDKAKPNYEQESAVHKIYHFGIRVSDLNEWENTVSKFDLKLYYGGVIEYPSSKSWYIRDPSGHEIEVSYSTESELRFPS